MFMADLRGALLRRWYVVLAGLAMTVGLAAAAVTVVPPNYASTAYVLLLPPRTAVPNGGNPYLALGGLSATADVVSRALTDDESLKALNGAGSAGTFEAAPDATTSGPVIAVTATADTTQGSLTTLDTVLRRIPTTLVTLQQSTEISQSSYIVSTVIARDEAPTVGRKTQVRAVVLAVGVGIVITVTGAGAVDAWILRRRPGAHPSRSPKAPGRGRGENLALKPNDVAADADQVAMQPHTPYERSSEQQSHAGGSQTTEVKASAGDHQDGLASTDSPG